MLGRKATIKADKQTLQVQLNNTEYLHWAEQRLMQVVHKFSVSGDWKHIPKK